MDKRSNELITVSSSTPQLAARNWHEQQRLALWIGGGLTAGLAMAALSPKHWAWLGAAAFGASAWLLRSPIGPAVLAAVLARASAPPSRVVTVEVVPAAPGPPL